MPIRSFTLTSILLFSLLPFLARADCGEQGIWLQVLGSGGPELDDGRASSGYLIWHDARARILIDIGSGSLFRFEQSGAKLNDLDMLLLSHLHVDHSADLPSLIKASYFSGRDRDLPLFGPTGNALMPSASNFVQGLFGIDGVFRYLSEYLDGTDLYRLIPHDVNAGNRSESVVLDMPPYKLTAVAVHHGPVPALAWRVEIAGKTIVFSGDMNNDYGTVAKLAKQADVFVAHNAITEEAGRVARNLHMPPSVIGEIAEQADVKKLVLSHRMNRTLGYEQQTMSAIRQHYEGALLFADDLQCFRL
ncbi:MAG TPA: MBL fold metallo-hydrolase [Gammaproteobacteria bacterium]|nr:MBL fold metallo-hydrolase [Gammaproteobacteria bacterium]